MPIDPFHTASPLCARALLQIFALATPCVDPIQISFSRGKKRYMFDFRFELKWEAPDLKCGPASGVLMYPDVGQDCNGEYDVECRVSLKDIHVNELMPCFGFWRGSLRCGPYESRFITDPWAVLLKGLLCCTVPADFS